MLYKNCLNCGKKFYFDKYRLNDAKFCSRSCSAKYNYPLKKDGLIYDKHGKNHPMWTGGKVKNTQGYVLIYSPEHPFRSKAGYVREHRLIMEKFLGRFLLKSEVVHHLNEIKDDNQLENLELTTKKKHDENHGINSSLKYKNLRIQKICPLCNNIFSVPQSHSWIVCCSRKCSTLLRWKNGKSDFGR
jgi:hypothetical protein